MKTSQKPGKENGQIDAGDGKDKQGNNKNWEQADIIMKRIKDKNLPEKEKEMQLENALSLYNQGITEIQNLANSERQYKELFSKRANVFMGLGQYQMAITDLWSAIRHDSTNTYFFSQLARCNQEIGQITEA